MKCPGRKSLPTDGTAAFAIYGNVPVLDMTFNKMNGVDETDLHKRRYIYL